MTTGLSSAISSCSLAKVTVLLGALIGGRLTMLVPLGAGGGEEGGDCGLGGGGREVGKGRKRA